MKTNYTQDEIKPAIARSISHTEIVTVACTDQHAAVEAIDGDENVSDLYWSEENDGSLYVSGVRLGGHFRLRLVKSA